MFVFEVANFPVNHQLTNIIIENTDFYIAIEITV